MTASAMPAEKFWHIMQRAAESSHDPDAHVNALRALLRELTLEEIISFEVAFRRYLNEAYTWDLWGAAYLINGGCSDDGFEYFRRWLVSRGRDIYAAALAKVFKEKGGEGDVRDHSEPEAGMGGPGPTGEPFTEDEERFARRYPKLWQRFGTQPLG